MGTVQRNQKELGEDKGDYKSTTWKPHSDCFDKKRTPEFVGEMQPIIDNNFSKLI